jgi:hypothetical protein
MKKINWLKETARDIISLGSLPFFVLVLVRLFINPDIHYISQVVLAGIVFFLFMLLFKPNMYSGLGFILLVFVSLYYNDLKFGIFSGLLYLCLIASLIYLKTEKGAIVKGVLFGALSTAISYFLVKWFFGF